jgi:hypothetical protein
VIFLSIGGYVALIVSRAQNTNKHCMDIQLPKKKPTPLMAKGLHADAANVAILNSA